MPHKSQTQLTSDAERMAYPPEGDPPMDSNRTHVHKFRNTVKRKEVWNRFATRISVEKSMWTN